VPKRAYDAPVKSPAERGVIGAWATDARAEADLSVPEVVAALAARGYRVTEPTIRGVEGGSKRPSRRLIRMLAEVYDKPAPGEPEVPIGDLGRIRDALETIVALLAIREGISPSALPHGARELADQLLGERDARQEEAAAGGSRQAGGA